MTSVPWTDARVESLKALWLEGLSASQIALSLGGVTRNAVIGKLHRVGAAGRAKPSAPRPVRQTPKRARERPSAPATPHSCRRPPGPRAAVVAAPAASELAPLVSDLTTLGAGACRWPIGDPATDSFGFCGRSRERGPYCEDHASRAYRGAVSPERDPFLRLLIAGAGL